MNSIAKNYLPDLKTISFEQIFSCNTENAVLSYSHQETLYVTSGQKVYIRLTSNSFNSLNRPEDQCDEKTESSYNDVRERSDLMLSP